VLQALAGEGLAQLQGPGGVLDHLQGLQARELGEEPAATGEHQQGVALHLQELQGRHPIGLLQTRDPLSGEEFRQHPGAAVQEHLVIGVSGGPRVLQVFLSLALENPGQAVV